MEALQGLGDHHEKVNLDILHENSAPQRHGTPASSEQHDLVQTILDTLLSRCPIRTKREVDICFEASNAAVRYTSSFMYNYGKSWSPCCLAKFHINKN